MLCRAVIILVFLLALIPFGHAQTINTYAGGVVLEGQPATSTPLNVPRGVAVDSQGNLFIVETAGGLVRRVDAVTGIATIIAGGGTELDDARPIPGRQAALDGPTFGGVDGLGNFYFCDTNNHRIRKVTTDGMITTVVGTGLPGFSGDGGPATRAQLSYPEGLYVDVLGNLWISDTGNHRIRMVKASDGIIQTVAGAGKGGEGSKALEVALGSPRGLTQDRQSNIFVVADLAPDFRTRILRIDANSGVVTTVGAGEVIQIYATGLGATNPAVATGTAAPDPPARVTLPVTMTIGGREATVEFAGLAPGFVGLYQVNARVPAGLTAASTVPVVITQTGIASNTVTIAVK